MDNQNYTVEELICNESFQRYCKGQNSADTSFWETWIKNNPTKIHDAQEAARIVSILNGNQGNVQVQLDHLKDSIRRFEHLKSALDDKSDPSFTIARKSPRLKYFVGIAASVLILVVAGYFLFFQKSSPPPPVATVYTHSVIKSGSEPRKTVVLPDGSVVTLRQNSTLELSDQFSKTDRQLNLSGEAFFVVAHNEAIPFIVHTKEVNIQVLGTVFNVSAYPGTARTETSLFRGKVEVTSRAHPEQKVILTPNRKLVFDNSIPGANSTTARSLQVVPLTADPKNHKAKEIAWIRNRLKIEDEPLAAIAKKLQDWYGINIIFNDDEVKTYRYSGTFESETVIKALEALQLSYPFSFQVENEKIIISR